MSPNEKILAVTNLYDGIDWYSLIPNQNRTLDTVNNTSAEYPLPWA